MRTLVEEPVNRRKPSSFSHQSEDILAGGLQPLRPPNDPPHSTLAQTNSGFARFLKEHTSPKHQRVTAGGRIVPMEPQTPVPKFRLTLRKRTDGDCDEGDDLTIVTRDDDRGSKLESEDTQTVEVGPGPAGSTPSRSVRLLPNLARSSLVQGSETYTNAFGMPGLFPPAATNTGAFLQQDAVPFSYNTSQLPFNADGPLPPYYSAYGAGIDAGSCFPACYPPMPAQEFITAGQTRIQQPTSVPRFSEGAASGSISAGSASSCGQFSSGFDTRACLGPQWQWQAGGPLPAFSQPHVHPAAYRENPYQSRLKEVRGQYDILSAQLSRIDRHMALNAWDIDGQSKTLLVEQRKSLVRELDVLRLYIEQLEQSLDMTKWGICDSTASAAVGTPTPMGNPYTHLVGPRTLVPNLIYGMQSIPAPPFPNTFPEFFPSIDSTGGTFPVQNADNSAYYSSDAQEETAAANRHNQRPRPQQSLSVNIPHGPVETGLQASTGEDATESAAPDDNRWATPARSSPLELQQIYHRIEEANKRGEKLDGLLRELSSATSELLRRRQEESRRPCQPISGQGTMVYPSMVAAGATRGASDNIESNLHLMRHGRRPWASEFYPREHSSTHKCMPRKDAEADGNMSSSCVSTTDSWATLHETDIRQPGSEALRSGSKGVDDSGSWERYNQP
ncbi:predicted protein [Aspergillus terreus NIH2624]|uniref:Uncharacterized protein n=1 Tax=Aspergillus terreus (strain NIH 2624 / FGSC A1156) TaxID=341663 RepID=Q0CW14_ASPTN|nr:uncharacterized protein ATEG_02120 [Aspergillus terreus NIH2624]EAU37082.1 predicted protein [Aspergillus terreus NIH2624]